MRGWGIAVLGVVLFGGGLVWKQVQEENERARARDAAEARDQAAVTIAAHFSKTCPADHPISITVTNATRRTLKSVRFHLAVFESGRSDDLNSAFGSDEWTYVVAPGESVTNCRTISEELGRGRFVLKAEKTWTDAAVFYADGEFIPRAAPSSSSATAAQPAAR